MESSFLLTQVKKLYMHYFLDKQKRLQPKTKGIIENDQNNMIRRSVESLPVFWVVVFPLRRKI